jgi:hypothetical protein
MSHQLADLVEEIDSFVDSAASTPGLAEPDVRRVLRFISQVIQVVEQSFQDVLALLVDIKLLRPEELKPARIDELRRSSELLTARSRFHDALEICSKLRHLSAHYHDFIEPIVGQLPNSPQWHTLLRLLDQHEGAVINLIHDSTTEISRLLDTVVPTNLESIKRTAADRANELRAHLTTLHDINGRILGLSGKTGFIELTATPGALQREVTIYMDKRDQSTTHGHRVTIGDGTKIKGNLVIAHDITDSFNQAATTADPNLKKLLEQLCAQVEKLLPALPPDQQAQAKQDLSTFVAEATSDKPRRKWYELSAEGLVEAAKACGNMAGPVAQAVGAILPILARI